MIIIPLVLSIVAFAPGDARFLGAGGGPLGAPPGFGPCIPPAERAEIARRLAASIVPVPVQASASPLLPTRSLGGNHDEDVHPGSFVDLDPAPFAYHDFACGDLSRDTHGGHDIGLRSFDEQAIGVAVFAVRPGVVKVAQDGFPDMNTAGGSGGNFVIVDHGGGEEGWYFHLKNGSVAVSVGQGVVAGQPLGLAASSGNSYGPHLHFEIQRNGAPHEPSAGPCRPGPSDWARQDPLDLQTAVTDVGVTATDLWTVPGLPFRWPTDSHLAFTDGALWIWAQGRNLPAGTKWKMRFVRPNGTLSFESATFDFGNPFWRDFGVWTSWFVGEMHTIAGTWTIEWWFDDALAIAVPVEVFPTKNPSFNRPPEPVTVAFDPETPSPHGALFARVAGPVALDDLDGDVVRFHWVWRVNGNVVRDVTTAGRADAIPHGSFAVGDTVLCTVTPSDGTASAAPAQTSASVAPDPWTNLGLATFGQAGVPFLAGSGALAAGSPGALDVAQARPNAPSLLFVALAANPIPALGGTLVPNPILLQLPFTTDGQGAFHLPFLFPPGVPSGTTLAIQAWTADPTTAGGASATNGVIGRTP